MASKKVRQMMKSGGGGILGRHSYHSRHCEGDAKHDFSHNYSIYIMY